MAEDPTAASHSLGEAPDWAISEKRDFSRELTRVVREQFAFLIGWAGTDRADISEAIHRVRQAAKRIRAIGQLLRREIPDDGFRLWNDRLRDEARKLSCARDADVMVETFESVVQASALRGAKLNALSDRLVERSAAARRDIVEAGTLRACVRTARELEPALLALVPPVVTAGLAKRGAAKAYQRARRQLARTQEALTDSRLHELRIRGKVVRAHIELLAPHADAKSGRLEALHLLNDELGGDRDRAMLMTAVQEELVRYNSPPMELLALLGAIGVERREFQGRAIAAAQRAFEEKAKSFAGDLLG